MMKALPNVTHIGDDLGEDMEQALLGDI